MKPIRALLVLAGLGFVAIDLASYLHAQKQHPSPPGNVETSLAGPAGRRSSDNRSVVGSLHEGLSDGESRGVPDPAGSVDDVVAIATSRARAVPRQSEEQMLSGVASSAARFLDQAHKGINAYTEELEKLEARQQSRSHAEAPVTVMNAMLRRRVAPYLESMHVEKRFVDSQNLSGCLGQQQQRIAGGMERMIEAMNRASSLGSRSETILGYSFSGRELRLELGLPSEATQDLSSGSQAILDSLIGFKGCRIR